MKRWLPLLIALALALGAVFGAVAEDPEGDTSEPAATEARESKRESDDDEREESHGKSDDDEREEAHGKSDDDEREESHGKSDDDEREESHGKSDDDDDEREEAGSSEEPSGGSAEEQHEEPSGGSEEEQHEEPGGEDAGEQSEEPGGEDAGEQSEESGGEGADELSGEPGGEGADEQSGESGGEDTEEQAGEAGGEGAEEQSEDPSGEDTGEEIGEPVAEAGDAGETEAEVSKKVLKIQNWLVALGYLKADQVTGIYDDATREAVADFQAANGLTATGECDGETYSLLKARAEALIDGGAEEEAEATATPTPTPAPSAGAEDETASELQKLLLRLGYLTEADLTGEYDAATAAALAMFQEASGLEATGVPDVETLALLQAAAGGGATTAPGYSAEEIAQLQQQLLKLGYLIEAELTGAFDEVTVAALIKFQKENGLEATGLLDEATLAALQKLAGGTGMGGGKHGGSKGGGSPTPTPDPRLHGVTPGTALTSTHSSGDKDTSTYGSVDLSDGAKDLDITLLTGAGEALSEDGYSRSVSNKTLTLSADRAQVQRWQFDGVTLRSLNRSGIQKLTLSGGGRPLTLNIGDLFTGDVYSALRAKGCTDNTFSYTVTVRDGDAEIAVDIQGERYTARQEAGGALRLYREAN